MKVFCFFCLFFFLTAHIAKFHGTQLGNHCSYWSTWSDLVNTSFSCWLLLQSFSISSTSFYNSKQFLIVNFGRFYKDNNWVQLIILWQKWIFSYLKHLYSHLNFLSIVVILNSWTPYILYFLASGIYPNFHLQN